jgi:hypothetical protein
MKELSVSPGDGVFVLGFPMNIAGRQRNYVIARQGCVARIGEMLDGASPLFLLDSFVFPGNSGGPVVADVGGDERVQERAVDRGTVSGGPCEDPSDDLGIAISFPARANRKSAACRSV